MKLLTFVEFFDLPPGVLFSQLPSLPHHNPGLYLKGESHPASDKDDDGPGIVFVDLTNVRDNGDYEPLKPVEYNDVIYRDSLDDGHRFAVFEADELAFLAGAIEIAWRVMGNRSDG